MEKFCEEELAFVRHSILNGVRIDLRGSNEIRDTIHAFPEIAQSDGSVSIRRGMSEVEVSIQFKECIDGLVALKLVSEEFISDEAAIESSVALPRFVHSLISESLKPYKVGVRINLNVINDDGNVYDLFFLGLRLLFESVEMPFLEDLHKTAVSKINIPTSASFALIGNAYVKDPTKIEESASHGLIRLFVGDNREMLGIFSEGVCNIERSALIGVLEAVAS